MLSLSEQPLWLNIALFTIAALAVWRAGTRLSAYAEVISDRTGLGKAFTGALLLGGITSLPEIAAGVTAAAIGNAPLAVNNVLGGITMQVALLAVADRVVRARPIASLIGQSAVMLQGSLLILVLALTTVVIVLNDLPLWRGGIGSLAIAALVLLCFFMIQRHRQGGTWRPVEDSPAAAPRQSHRREQVQSYTRRRLIGSAVAAGAVILIGGFVLANTADALARQTGLGANLAGFVLLAIATSLPELSTTIAAVRLGQYDMAFSNILGTNLLDVSFLLLIDLTYAGGPVLNEVADFSAISAVLGIAVTTLYMVGFIERRTNTVARLGIDSLLVLCVYLGGLFVLFSIR